MKVLNKFNDVPQELLDTIPKLKEGQVMTFQMLTGVNIPDAESNVTNIVYGKVQVPCRDRIKDPKDSRKFYDIGLVEEFDPQTLTPLVFKFFMPGKGESQFLGKFDLVGGNSDDEELLEFLWLSNYNDSNPNRDKRVHPLFRPIDVVADAKKTRKRSSSLRDAMILATDLDLPVARNIAQSLNWPEFFDDEVLRGKIEQYAQEEPDEFLKIYGDPQTMIKSDIKRAIDKGILIFDPAGNRMTWAKGNAVIATFDRKEGFEHLSAFAEWCLTSKNGTDVLKGIRKKLKETILQTEDAE